MSVVNTPPPLAGQPRQEEIFSDILRLYASADAIAAAATAQSNTTQQAATVPLVKQLSESATALATLYAGVARAGRPVTEPLQQAVELALRNMLEALNTSVDALEASLVTVPSWKARLAPGGVSKHAKADLDLRLHVLTTTCEASERPFLDAVREANAQVAKLAATFQEAGLVSDIANVIPPNTHADKARGEEPSLIVNPQDCTAYSIPVKEKPRLIRSGNDSGPSI
jgi:hypothetical protein